MMIIFYVGLIVLVLSIVSFEYKNREKVQKWRANNEPIFIAINILISFVGIYSLFLLFVDISEDLIEFQYLFISTSFMLSVLFGIAFLQNREFDIPQRDLVETESRWIEGRYANTQLSDEQFELTLKQRWARLDLSERDMQTVLNHLFSTNPSMQSFCARMLSQFQE